MQSLIVLASAAFSFFIFPVSGDAFLGNVMHILSADLHFERLRGRTNHRGVQRLIEIVARRCYPILNATGHRLPVVVDHSEGCVTMAYFVRSDNASCDQIVDLVKADFLPSKFLPNRIQAFDATFHSHKRHLSLRHLFFDTFCNGFQERFIFGTTFLQLLGQLAIVLRMQVTKGEIFQFASEFTHAQPVGNRSENVHRLFSDPFSLFRTQVVQRAHVM